MNKSIIFLVLLISCSLSGCAVAPTTTSVNEAGRPPLPADKSGLSEKRTEELRTLRGITRQRVADLNVRRTAGNAAKPSAADDVNPAQTSDDETYGYTKENPVKLGSQRDESVSSSYVYLRQLRDKARHPFKFVRIGNVGAGADGHIIDLYKLNDSVGAEFKIFVDMYHPESNPLDCKAPKGMFIAQ